MKYSLSTRFGVLLSALLMGLLFIPTLKWLKTPQPLNTLHGYTDPLPEKPQRFVTGFFNKHLQQWVESYFNARLGYRETLIRSFNEINFRIFHEAGNARLKIVTTKQHGLYSNLSIDSLNQEVLYKKKWELQYAKEADKLLKVQNILAAQGKYFEVVIASSKAYVYPKGLSHRYLVGGSSHIFNRAASFGNLLKSKGVNVVDAGPYLRHKARVESLETHPASGLHWNHASGCLIAKKILEDIHQRFPSIALLDCAPLKRLSIPTNHVDFDGFLLLNMWTGAGLLRPTIFPSITQIHSKNAWHPSIVFIGDSFSDHIRAAFREADIYSQLVMSSYFQTRSIDPTFHEPSTETEIITEKNRARATLLKDIQASDIVILEFVDYNANRLSYDFPNYFLKQTSS